MKNKAFIYIVIAGMLWGTSGIFVHYLAPLGLSSLQMASIRGTVAATFMVVYALIKDRNLFKTNIKQLALHIGGGVAMYLTGSCYYAAIQASSVSTAVMLMYTAPIIVMIFSVMFLGEKLNVPKCISVILMFLGCCFVSGVIGGFEFSVSGILLGFASGFAYSAYNILTKITMMHSYSPVSQNLYGALFMMLVSLAVCNPGEILPLTAKEPLTLTLALVALGVVTFVLPYLFFALGMKELPAATASALSTVEPLSACAFGIIIFGEKPDIFSLVGIALILVAVFLLGHSEKATSKTI